MTRIYSNGPERKRKPPHQRSSVQPLFFQHTKRKIELKGLAKPGNEDILLSHETLRLKFVECVLKKKTGGIP